MFTAPNPSRAALVASLACLVSGTAPPPSAAAQAAEPLCRDLIASQQETVGSVCVAVVGRELDIRIETSGEARLIETRVAVAATLEGFPLSESGVPRLGLYSHALTHQPPVAMVPYRIPIGAAAEGSEALLVSVHASVLDADAVEHGAWAAGTRFREPGSPATYFAVPLELLGSWEDSAESSRGAPAGSSLEDSSEPVAGRL